MDVFGLSWIHDEVVELRRGSQDVLPSPVTNAAQRGVTIVQERCESLDVRDQTEVASRLCEVGHQAATLDSLRRRQIEQLEQGGQNVDVSDLVAHPQAGGHGRRVTQEQGDPHGGVVDEVAVTGLVVLSESLPVVRGQEHRSAVAQAEDIQLVEDPPNLLIHVGNFPEVVDDTVIIGRALVRLPEPGRGLIGRVGVEEVDEEEERLVRQPT